MTISFRKLRIIHALEETLVSWPDYSSLDKDKPIVQLKAKKQAHISEPIFDLRKEILQYWGQALDQEPDGEGKRFLSHDRPS